MTVLIELYDATESFHNILSLTAIKPDVLVVLGDVRIQREKEQRCIRDYIRSAGLKVETQFRCCGVYDFTQMTACMEQLMKEFGPSNCIVDVLGGSEALLMAVGYCCKEYPELRAVTHKARTNQMIWLTGPQKNTVFAADFTADLASIIALSGGQLVRNGHVDRNDLGDDVLDLIPDVFAVYMRNRSQWATFVQYLQQLNEPEYQTGKAAFCGPDAFQLGRRRVTVNAGIVRELMACRVVTKFTRAADTCTLHFCSEQLLRYLCDVGAWLELYTYSILYRSGMFRSVEISAVISWDDDDDNRDTTNEIDVIALDGMGQLFISCKTATPDNSVLQEIATLTERFGTRYAMPVLVTASDLEQEAPGVYRRAMEMGITVIDANDLKADAFLKKLRSLRRTWNVYVK